MAIRQQKFQRAYNGVVKQKHVLQIRIMLSMLKNIVLVYIRKPMIKSFAELNQPLIFQVFGNNEQGSFYSALGLQGIPN